MLVAAVALAFGVTAPACSGAYRPQPSARVGVIIQHGGAFYVKDGRAYPIGPLGGPLEALVSPSPDAAATAQRGRRQLSAGVPLYLVGVAAAVVGLVASPSPTAFKWGLIGAGAATAGTGIGLMGAGVTNDVDAINLYNDSLTTRAPAAAPLR